MTVKQSTTEQNAQNTRHSTIKPPNTLQRSQRVIHQQQPHRQSKRALTIIHKLRHRTKNHQPYQHHQYSTVNQSARYQHKQAHTSLRALTSPRKHQRVTKPNKRLYGATTATQHTLQMNEYKQSRKPWIMNSIHK